MIDVKRLRFYMNENECNQGELARITGISEATISAYFNNKSNPTVENAIAICEKLNIPLVERGKIFLVSNFQKSKDTDKEAS